MKDYKNFAVRELSSNELTTVNGGDNPLVKFIKRLFGERPSNPHPCGGIGSQSKQ